MLKRFLLTIVLLSRCNFLWCQTSQELFNRGVQASESNDIGAARTLLENAYSKAIDSRNSLLAAQAAMGLLRLIELQLQARSSALDPANVVTEAQRQQERVEASGTDQQKQAALNSLGVIFIRLEMPDAAVEVFKKIQLEKSVETERYIYLFNYGRALEQYHDPVPSDRSPLDVYLESLESAPEFQPTIDALTRILENQGPRGIDGALRVAEVLVSRKLGTQTTAWLHYALARWAGQPQSEELLGYLLRHYNNIKLSSIDFEAMEWPVLNLLTHHGSFWSQALNELRQAYAGFPLDPGNSPKAIFPTWKNSNLAGRFSSLLLQIGESTEVVIEDSNDSRIASVFNRYIAAWIMSSSNATALARAASILDQHPKMIDMRWRQFFIAESSSMPVVVPDPVARSSFSQFHVTLGRLLADNQLKMSGSTLIKRTFSECGDGNSPGSPLYEWQHAVEVETGKPASEAVSKSSPQLNRWLADCYKRLDSKAFTRFDDAVEESLKEYRQFTPFEGKLRYHLRAMSLGLYGFYGGGIVRSAFHAGLQQALDSPPSWKQGWQGFGRRLASTHGTRIIRNSLALTIETAFGEDPHYLPSGRSDFSSRLRSVVSQTFVTRTDRLGTQFAWWRIGSAAGSEMVSNLWRPPGSDLGGHEFKSALFRTAFMLGSDTLSNGFREFITPRSRLGRLFASFFNR